MAKHPAAHQRAAQRSVTYTIMFLGTLALAVVGAVVAILGFFGFGSATQFSATGADKFGGIQTTSVGLAIMFLSLLAMVVMAINKPRDVQPYERAATPGAQRFVDGVSDNAGPLAVIAAIVLALLVARLVMH